MTRPTDVRISGAPTAHEVAAVVAALHAFESTVETLSAYERWRRRRLAALHRDDR
jgi:hypothetical protein